MKGIDISLRTEKYETFSKTPASGMLYLLEGNRRYNKPCVIRIFYNGSKGSLLYSFKNRASNKNYCLRTGIFTLSAPAVFYGGVAVNPNRSLYSCPAISWKKTNQ
jgi:hypothetical protein